MLVVLALALGCWSPQTPASTTPAQVPTTANGWPAGTGEASVPPAAATRDPGGEPGGFAPLDPARSPLLPVFLAVGTPADAAALGGVSVALRTIVYDHRGATLGEREAVHEADLSVADRDRLLSAREQVYGRDGPAVFALYRGLSFPGVEAEAREELAWAGLLLRVPWVFADAGTYTVGAREELLWNGRPMSRFRIATRVEGDAVPDRFEMWCEPDTSEPRVLLWQPANPAARACRVRLLEFRPVGNVRMPMRRVVEGADGSRRLEIELSDVRTSQAFPRRHFAPPAR